MGHMKAVTRRKSSSSPSRQSGYFTRKSNRDSSEASLFQRRIRVRGSSSASVPLSLVLLSPILVFLVVLLLFLNHSTSPNDLLKPLSSPQSIRKISEKHDKVFAEGCRTPDTKGPRANACILILAKNDELEGVIHSIKSIERHFNRWFHYPYVFLNNEDFESYFKKTVRNYVSSPTQFGKIEPSMWGFPDWMDPEEAKEGIRKQGDNAIMYGDIESYHHMCRFYSGFFYKHEILLDYKWYWRVEPDVDYFCDITYDPFIEMEKANKTYGFTIAVKELKATVPNIFRYASAYKRRRRLSSKGLWEMFTMMSIEDEEIHSGNEKNIEASKETHLDDPPLIDYDAMEGEVYNLCHFWSNFEIARLDWFRSKEYEEYFQVMDQSGGFWMERWGDAPVHSLAAGALLAPSDIHYFRDFGYRHTTISHCPANAPLGQIPRQPYLERTTLNDRLRKEEDDYWASPDPPKANGVGCRCRCDTDVEEVEVKGGSCIAEWVHVAGGWATPLVENT